MRKVVIHKAGRYDRLRLETHTDLRPAPDEVVVRTEAIGVNYADCIIRMGLYQSARDFVGWPITPGFEFAGRVASTGRDVRDLPEGTAVFGVTRFGGYATQVAVPRHQLFRLPDTLSMTQGATFSVVSLSAYYALFELANVRPEMQLLVHSAAGGVGGAITQLARITGCRVVGVVGMSSKIEAARSFGAHDVIDKSREDLWRGAACYAPGGYDVVLDANGTSTLAQSYAHLASPGRLVVYGFHSMLPRGGRRPNYAKLAADFLRMPRFSPLAMTNENRSVLAFNLSYLFHEKDTLQRSMSALLDWLAQGKLKAPPVRAYPLRDVAEAHRAIESGSTVGKLALVP